MPDPSSDPGSTPDPVLVVGATGTVGGAVLAALTARGASVRALVRHRQPRLDRPGVEQVVGDLADPGSVRAALARVSAACYVSPHADEEEAYARIFVRVCAASPVRVVFVGVHVSARSLRGRVTGAAMSVLLPAYRPKLRIGRLIERALPTAVLLVPASFYDNDDLFVPDIVAGTYPCPMRGVNRVAVADIGVAAARVLLDPGFPPGTYPVCGPRSYSGAESAAVWAAALGRPIRYTGADPVAWRLAADRRLPRGRKGQDYRASFRLLGRVALSTDPDAVVRTTALLGREPLDYRVWVQARVAGLQTEVRSA